MDDVDPETEVLKLRYMLVDTEHALATLIAGIERGDDPHKLAADARSKGAHGWVEEALKMLTTTPVRY